MTTTETIWKSFHAELHNFINKRVHDKEASNDILHEAYTILNLI